MPFVKESKSSRYHRRRRWAESFAVAAQALVLVGAVVFDLSLRLSESAAAASLPTRLAPMAVIAANGLVLSLAIDLAALPFFVYSRYSLERRYRASRSGLTAWLRAYTQAMGVYVVVWVASATLLYTIIQRWPGGWWLAAGIVLTLLTITVTYLGPRLVLPRLYDLRPIARPELRARLGALTCRVGTPVMAIQEWRSETEVSRPSAALVGLGATRQVLLSDSLLADYTDEEIEVVFAHELAHDINNDIWQMIVYEGGVATLACGTAHLVLNWTGPAFGVSGVGDVTGLPMLVMVAGGVVGLLAPVSNVLSRWHERRADRYALDVTNNPEALASSLRRLGEQTLAEEHPSRLVTWLFYTHPPLANRAATGAVRSDDACVRWPGLTPRTGSPGAESSSVPRNRS